MFENRNIGYALALPAAVFAALLFLLPVGILLSEAFFVEGHFSFKGYIDFFATPLNQKVFFRTLKIGFFVTLASAIVGYACAFAIVNLPASQRGKIFGLVILPLMISPVARTYAWIVILGRTGIVNDMIVGLGLSDTPLRLLFTETAVFIGLLQLFMPLMIISLVSAMENMPSNVVSAARVLGAGWLQVFWRVIIPLTKEGLVMGGTLVFAGSLTAYITPAILGGAKVLMLETLLYQRVNVSNDYVSASVIAMILISMSFGTNQLLKRVSSRR